MSTVLDYQDRRFDISAFRDIVTTTGPSGRLTPLPQELFNEDTSGEIVTGILKLSQRFTLEFLTERGSITYLPNRGTEFMTLIRQGRLTTESDIIAEFNFALVDIRRNLSEEEDDTMDLDEKLDTATLDSIAILPDFLQMTITVISEAGNSRTVILPISVLPIQTVTGALPISKV